MGDPASSGARLCRIEKILGRNSVCPGDPCPFWEKGGGPGGWCAFEKVDFASDPELAEWLAHVRKTLETA